METISTALYAIEIKFEKNTRNPARIFKTMTDLIEAFEVIDRVLVSSIDTHIEPVMMIEDIEIGSLRGWFANELRLLDDTSMGNLEWKKIVGNYLVRGKYLILNFLDGKTEITDRKELEELESNLLQSAKDTGVLNIPTYAPVRQSELLPGIKNVSNALSNLNDKDKAIYKTKTEEVIMNATFTMLPDKIEELITSKIIRTTAEMILKIKKPDYLGESQWEFRYGTKAIMAKIGDREWLQAFQKRSVDIRPGDSLRANVEINVSYGYDYEVIGESYILLSIIEILQTPPSTQMTILNEKQD